MTESFLCVRCRKSTEPLESRPYPGELGEELAAKVCARCWHEWQQMEVMVINELRLDFMDPKSQEILIGHLREFLCLDGPPEKPSPFATLPPEGLPPEGSPFGGSSSEGDPSGGSSG